MPYGKGYNNYRNYGRKNNNRIVKNGKRRYYQKRKTYIPRSVYPELKWVDTELSAFTIALAWTAYNPTTVNCLNAVAQGDGPSNRDGRVYYIHSVMVKLVMFTDVDEAAVAPKEDLVTRLCLVLDTQANGTEINAANVMETAGSVGDYLEFRNLEFSGRFRILKDTTKVMKRFYVNEGSGDLFASARQLIRWDWYVNFVKPIKVVCNGTGSGIGDVTNNALAIIASSGSVSDIQCSYLSRIRFSG